MDSVKERKDETIKLLEWGFREYVNINLYEENETIIEADAVIVAFGFRASPADWFSNYQIETKDNGLLKVDNEYLYQTTNDKIFAGGDMTRGSDLVVTAVFEGREAAENILDYLEI